MARYDIVRHMERCDNCLIEWERGTLPNGKRLKSRRYNGLDAKRKVDCDFCSKRCMEEFEAAHPEAREG